VPRPASALAHRGLLAAPDRREGGAARPAGGRGPVKRQAGQDFRYGKPATTDGSSPGGDASHPGGMWSVPCGCDA
jgi:hypothetical protein